MKKVLIVGYGSIGQRHFKNFSDLDCEVSIVSRRQLAIEAKVYSSLEESLILYKPDIVFVCNETYLHAESLKVLKAQNFSGLIIVEKPIFDLKFSNYEDFINLNIRVSYNLRFTSLLQYLKRELLDKKVVSAQVYVGQYLPTWRKNVDYKTTYSADESKGGGVLLDLSHELDFCSWLFGHVQGLFSLSGKWSDLEINSIDTCGIIARFEKCPMVDLQLNYTDRKVQRYLTLTTLDSTYKVDFISKQVFKNKDEVQLEHEATDSYAKMSYDILYNAGKSLTSYSESVHLMKVMNAVMLSSQKLQWVKL